MLTTRLGRRLGQVAWGLFAASFVAGACGNKDDSPPVPPSGSGLTGAGGNSHYGTGGAGGRGGTTGASGEAGSGANSGVGDTGPGGEGGGSSVDPRTPIVRITSPAAVSDPNGDGVITESEIDVVCTAVRSTARGSSPVDPGSVLIQMLDADGNPVPTSQASGTNSYAATPTANDNEYSAHVLMNKVSDNGKVGFTCTATDSSSQRLIGSDTVTTFVDHGPVITIGQPAKDSPHALNGSLDVDFTVDASPLVASGDKGAAITSVTLELAGRMLDLTQNKNKYSASAALSDSTQFPATPTGDTPITIHAIDKRGADRVESYSFQVDGEGPDITIASPVNGAVVGGHVPLTFKVTDAISGVDQKSVTVILNDVENPYGQGGDWSVTADGTYTFRFDSTQIKESKAQATINIRAADMAGNDSMGQSWLLYLDNVPPIVDLDPGNVRAWKTTGSSSYECSTSFDPLGSFAMNDLQLNQSRFAFPRALVWEETNSVTGQKFVTYSGVDDSTVQIYIQPDPTQPFLINNPKDPDPACDDIDPDALGSLHFIKLDPIQPTGAATYQTDDPAASPPIADFPDVTAGTPASCTLGADISSPPGLCTNNISDLTTAIAHTMEGRPPVIYALGPLAGIECTGKDWEIGAIADTVGEGWVCLAGRAVDKAGNVGISKPLRLCYDDPATSFVPDCMNGSPPPSCTDGCTSPPTFPGNDSAAFIRAL